MTKTFTHKFRVRYAEVDPQGVVFNSRYLEYADLMVTEFWRDIGLHFMGEDALEFHIAKSVVNYRKPILLDEAIVGQAKVTHIGNTSMVTGITLRGADDPPTDQARAEIELVQVHVDLPSGRPLRISASVRAAFGYGDK
ncbi:thioesterase family protein [Altererythrobacter aquiaggeris]|uniref:acyl-CoA thioesterase n=1 Tax=Aestuarierythrobacter aquiaggeris TaxID=1898396 RepID=UPI0030198E57